MLSSENFGDMISCDILRNLCWSSGLTILMISQEFVAGIVINFCWNFDQSILMISSDRSDNSHKLLMIILMKSLESYDETLVKSTQNCRNLRWKYWQCFLSTNILGLCSWCVATTTDPWLACFHYISELFDGYQKNLETPQNLLRNPQNFRNLQIVLRRRQIFLRILILRFFDDPRNFPRIRKFWGSSENSEDEDPQKILRMTIHRKFWGWRSSEISEASSEFWGVSRFFDNHQKNNLLMIIPLIIRYIRCSSERWSLQKNVSPRAKLSTKQGPIVYTDNTQCFTCFVCFFPGHQSYIHFFNWP